MLLVGIRAGRTQTYDSPDGEWRSAIAKQPVLTPVPVDVEGIHGDKQYDRRYHGGPEKAVLAYSRDHYDAWRLELNRPDFGPGVLGENLEIAGQSEATVCIGDTYRIGTASLQVSQPRQPCWKPAYLHGIPELTAQMGKTSRTGWYFRVLQPGDLDLNVELELLDRPHPEWTVLRANHLIYQRAENRAARLELADLPELSTAWKDMLRKKA